MRTVVDPDVLAEHGPSGDAGRQHVGQTIPNTVITKIGAGGQTCLDSDQTTYLLADVNGAF